MNILDLMLPLAGREARPLFLIAGPCVIEDEEKGAGYTLGIARRLQEILAPLEVPWVFKASFDKANRTSLDSFRGPGLESGLKTLAEVKRELGVPVLTDVHETGQVEAAAEAVDVLQVPAFLCRQTDLVVKVARHAKAINVKKGQFLAPQAMEHVIRKIRGEGRTDRVTLTERGVSFGYGNLVVDMTSIPTLRGLGAPAVFDATHSVQLPGGLGKATGGRSDMVPVLALAAVAAGADGLFMEVHPDPEHALSDGPNMVRLDDVETLVRRALAVREAIA